MADYTKYTNKEMQAITLAQQITDDNIAIVGTGLPLIGASVAKRLFAPKCNLIVESGLMDLLAVFEALARKETPGRLLHGHAAFRADGHGRHGVHDIMLPHDV